MSDIDFDELDKAVNSLMGSVKPEKTGDADKELNTLSISSTLKDNEKPEYEKLDEVARKIGDETLPSGDKSLTLPDDDTAAVEPPEQLPEHDAPHDDDTIPVEPEVDEPSVEPAPPVAPAVKRRSTGRFMDMVHPSADMRGSSNTSSLPVPTRPEPSEPEQPKNTFDTQPAAALPQSPFLPDAKVEKRPLGGETPKEDVVTEEGSQEPTAALTPEPTSEIVSAVEEKSEEPVETSTINNEEKQTDDGSGDEQRTLDPTNFDVEAAMQERKLQSIESAEATEPAKQDAVRAVESGDTGKTVEHLTGTPSADTSGDIYNVGEYHQPIAHPAKQKSGWVIVVIVAVIIILSMAAAGVAYFVFAKP